MRFHCVAAACFASAFLVGQSDGAEFTESAVNSASFADWSGAHDKDKPNPFVVRVQVLLDRTHISPGVIDGVFGENLAKAIRIFETREGLEVDGKIDEKFWSALSADAAPIIQRYSIASGDLSQQRFVKAIPEDYGQMAELDWLGYTGAKEMLAERFHMHEDLLAHLNPEADFGSAGTEILVAVIGDNAAGKVSRIKVDRSEGQLLAFAEKDLLVAYPATIGSAGNPSPSGTHKVKGVVLDPSYSYNPDKNFQQGDNTEPLEIPPGPNGPVGSVWIDLSEPTYGIHGTADPELIDKTQSHGCVRLTNWDARELAALVSVGVPVEFRE
jgi:lipoprotein-anchoring transpeptidase ErfK/SrfK